MKSIGLLFEWGEGDTSMDSIIGHSSETYLRKFAHLLLSGGYNQFNGGGFPSYGGGYGQYGGGFGKFKIPTYYY